MTRHQKKLARGEHSYPFLNWPLVNGRQVPKAPTKKQIRQHDELLNRSRK